jgi:transcriptional regulator with XRE-family HTH domain
MASLGDRIKGAREAKGLGTNELGRLAGTTGATISRLEGGERSKRGGSIETVAKIASALGVRAEWLASGAGAMTAADDPYPNRAQAAGLARDAGVFEEAIREVLLEEVRPEDASRPVLWWADVMRTRALEMFSRTSGGARRPSRPPPATARRPKHLDEEEHETAKKG